MTGKRILDIIVLVVVAGAILGLVGIEYVRSRAQSSSQPGLCEDNVSIGRPIGDAFISYEDDTDLILVLSTQDPPPPPKDRQLRLCLYNGELTITCGKDVDMDEASKVFFNEILKPMVDMYIKGELDPNYFMIKER